MSDSTSFTIPNDPGVLRAMSKYLLGRAEGAELACSECGCLADQSDVADRSDLEVAAGGFATIEAAASAATGEGLDVVKTDIAPPPPPAAEATDAAVAFGPSTDVAPPPPAAAPAGVDLDDDGLPWDSRINTSSKLKLAKEGTWKLIRGIEKKSPGLVEQVRAELRAAMAASPAAPVVTGGGSTDVPPAAPAPGAETVAPAPPADETTAPADSAEAPLDFAGFMAKVTAAGTPQETVLAAVKKAGLASIVLLATRPDLIPTVDAELFGVDP